MPNIQCSVLGILTVRNREADADGIMVKDRNSASSSHSSVADKLKLICCSTDSTRLFPTVSGGNMTFIRSRKVDCIWHILLDMFRASWLLGGG